MEIIAKQTSSTTQQPRLDLEIVRKHCKRSLLKGKKIELMVEFTDRQTGQLKARGKVFYQVRKKQFFYMLSDIKVSFTSIHYCLSSYKQDMEKLVYA